ncbi:MAG: thiamine-phosphate kinase [Deltaproteobacteria bacterium]|jgi:thiamine-monophosphate kinase
MLESIADIGEFGLIRRIEKILDAEGARPPEVILRIGDDTACFRPNPGYALLVTCDSVVEGRHYLAAHIAPLDLGHRAMALNISDIGAMGGRPRYALVSLGLKGDTPVREVEELYRGFVAELNPFGASIIGGNITKSEGGVFIDITLVGEVEETKMVRRSTARPGDVVLITGYPGEAAAGLKMLLQGKGDEGLRDSLLKVYNRPTHRAREGAAIAQSGYATAMIDTSDGFLGDLGHICEESHVGADLKQEKLPVSEALKQAAFAVGCDPYDLLLHDSDDYELIVTCPAARVASIQSAVAETYDGPVSEVGTITDRVGEIGLIKEDGTRQALAARGWDHFANADG